MGYNEMCKGFTDRIGNVVAESALGGWAFNLSSYRRRNPLVNQSPRWIPRTAEQASEIPDHFLIINPFFRRFIDNSSGTIYSSWDNGDWLYAETSVANQKLPDMKHFGDDYGNMLNHVRILASAIPAHSDAAGTVRIGSGGDFDNSNLLSFATSEEWPRTSDNSKLWHHGDYKTMAQGYVYDFYKEIIDSAGIAEKK